MIRETLTVLLTFALALPISINDTYSIQTRLYDLGYYNTMATGNYGPITQNAFNEFLINNGEQAVDTISEDGVNLLFSTTAVPKYDVQRNFENTLPLDGSSYNDISIPETFPVYVISLQKTLNFTSQEKTGYLKGSLGESFSQYTRYPGVATINSINYPVSFEFNGSNISLHFLDSIGEFDIEDSEHQYNIEKLLNP